MVLWFAVKFVQRVVINFNLVAFDRFQAWISTFISQGDFPEEEEVGMSRQLSSWYSSWLSPCHLRILHVYHCKVLSPLWSFDRLIEMAIIEILTIFKFLDLGKPLVLSRSNYLRMWLEEEKHNRCQCSSFELGAESCSTSAAPFPWARRFNWHRDRETLS